MNYYEQTIEKLKEKDNFRQIHKIEEKFGKYVLADGIKMLNLSSNDYLNLSTNKELKSEFIEKYSKDNEFIFSSASSRLLTGTSKVYKILEKHLASMFKKESALLFNTGYQL